MTTEVAIRVTHHVVLHVTTVAKLQGRLVYVLLTWAL